MRPVVPNRWQSKGLVEGNIRACQLPSVNHASASCYGLVAPLVNLSTNRVRRRGCKVARRRPSTNPAPTGAPEVYFRILYVTPPHGKYSEPEYRLTVEVTLGPWGAVENGNISRLERVVPAERLVSAVALPRRSFAPPKPLEPPKPGKPPRIVETLRIAMEWRRQLDAREVESQAAIARREGLTRARVTQILALLRLAPDILDSLLALAGSPNPPAVSEAALRPITLIKDTEQQLAAFEEAIVHRS